MAPLPSDNTGRFHLHYSDGLHPHTLMARFNDTASIPTIMDKVDAFLTAIATDLYLISVLGADFSDAGSNITVPVLWSGASTYGSGTMPAVFAPREIEWGGRSVGGRRFKVYVYGVDITTPDTFRQVAAGSNIAANGIAALADAQASGVFVAIDNEATNLYNYANLNFNSYWERKARA